MLALVCAASTAEARQRHRVAGFFVGILAYMSLPAPSVQGNASAPFWWLGSCLVLATIIAGSHWLPPIGCGGDWAGVGGVFAESNLRAFVLIQTCVFNETV
jgi:hypothetical protein